MGTDAFELADLLTVLGLLVTVGGATIGLLLELRRAAVERAAKVVAWAAIPHDGRGSAGIRGLVIVNNTEQVVTRIQALIHTDGVDLLDEYPVIPPGIHFLTVQERGRIAEGPAEQDPWPAPPLYGFWLLPVSSQEGALRVALRSAADETESTSEPASEEMVGYDLRPWIDADDVQRFALTHFSYVLGNTTWSRGADNTVRRVTWWTRLFSRELAESLRQFEAAKSARELEQDKTAQPQSSTEHLARVLPRVAFSESQILHESQQHYPRAFALLGKVAGLLVEGGLEPGQSGTPVLALRELGFRSVRRSGTRRTKLYGVRGGILLDFTLDGAVKAYSFGMSQYGDAPQWFVREAGVVPGSAVHEFRAEPPFARRKVDSWKPDGSDLATAILDTITNDLLTLRRGEGRSAEGALRDGAVEEPVADGGFAEDRRIV